MKTKNRKNKINNELSYEYTQRYKKNKKNRSTNKN